jgi:2-keto-4-pentenoate hydratase/2-oxohepta-3-ene-1,7-dioic acid hydratase in catechol pathway
MRFVSCLRDGRETWGAAVNDRFMDARTILNDRYKTLEEFVSSSDYARREALFQPKESSWPLGVIRYLPVIVRPEKIILVARNYLDHHNEAVAAGLKREITKYPPIFLRVWRSQVGHETPLIRPKVSQELDWEGELAVIIGKTGRHISEKDALEYVAGYSAYNDASVRDWQFHAQQIAAGKNFVGTGAFGPWMVTPDEIGDPSALKIETRVNGQVVQSSSTSHLIFGIPRLINYMSTIFDLVPGDVIVTGTPSGVGFARKPPRFLVPGDMVEVELEKIGILRNPVKDE